jgi:hypothetical protein
MSLLGASFESGRIADLILALTVAEGLILWLLHAIRGWGLGPLRIAMLLLPGVFLLLALRLALTGAWWGWIAAMLAAALVAHICDLALRLRR